MSQRNLRVNELIKREISLVLHTLYRDESVHITITDVQVAPDLRKARIYYSVFGNDEDHARAERFLSRRGESLRREVGKVVRLKYLPHFKFFQDSSLERGARLMDVFAEIDRDSAADDEPNDSSAPAQP